MTNSLANVPTLDAVNPGAVQSAASGISKAGTGIQETGANIVSAWGKLHGVYKAPEAGELFGAMTPVQGETDRFGWQVGQVGAALSDYAAEIAPVKAKLAALKAQAGVMLAAQAATPGGESHWRRKQSNVDAENALLHEVAAAMNQAHQIAAKCANRINGLTGGTQYHGGQGLTDSPGDYWANDPSHLSWADPVKQDFPWWKDGLHGVEGFAKGVVIDGAWGMVKGVGAMGGFSSKGWDWHTMWKSYKSIELLGMGLTVPGAMAIPAVRKTELKFGKDFVAWDEWKKDKGRAAGRVAFNVVTLGVPETRLGMAGKAGDVALAATRGVNKVDVVGHGLSLGVRYGAKGVRAGVDAVKNLHIGEGLSQLKGIHVQGLNDLHEPAPKVDPANFHLKDPAPQSLHDSPHASPHVKPTVRQLADHVESKFGHDNVHGNVHDSGHGPSPYHDPVHQHDHSGGSDPAHDLGHGHSDTAHRQRQLGQDLADAAEKKVNREIDHALEKVNPKFDPTKSAYRENCTGVVQANELRRRGMDVEAGPLESHLRVDQGGPGGRPLNVIEHAWNRNFTDGTKAEIEAAFQEPGARGVVYIRWHGNAGAHVFSVENVGGKVRFVDGQPTPPVADASHYFNLGGRTAYVRLDDLQTPDPNATKPYLEP